MRRQVVIGGLVGVALGGLLTASFAHGVLSWQRAEAASTAPQGVEPAPASSPSDDEAEADAAHSDARIVPVRPLRPGSESTARARAKVGQIAALPARTTRPSV